MLMDVKVNAGEMLERRQKCQVLLEEAGGIQSNAQLFYESEKVNGMNG